MYLQNLISPWQLGYRTIGQLDANMQTQIRSSQTRVYPVCHSIMYFNPCPAEPGYILFCKQCRSRSVGFWRRRSQLIWICTVCNWVCKFITSIWIKQPDWLKIRSGCGILIYSAGQGLIKKQSIMLSILHKKFQQTTFWNIFHIFPIKYYLSYLADCVLRNSNFLKKKK